MPSVNIELGDRSYPVVIGNGLLLLPGTWREYLPAGKILLVSNEIVAPLYLEAVTTAIGRPVETCILPDGETTKNMTNWSLIIDRLIAMQAGRDVCLVAVGGGVVGDICGFAAASYMRGVPFVQVPTTLLAQVDSSVGGKTAINHAKGKNLIGAFHQPRAVIADITTLNTLEDREFRAGMAEVIKCGAIRDAAFFDWLNAHSDAILSRDTECLERMVERSVRNKAEVVAEDEFEAGTRALLNFGHTFGHALETITAYTRFLHGEAVAIGMVIAARLSEIRGLCQPGVTGRLARLLSEIGLPTTLPGDIDADRMIAAMALDKKVRSGQLRLVLLTGIGQALVDSDSSSDEIRTALEQSR